MACTAQDMRDLAFCSGQSQGMAGMHDPGRKCPVALPAAQLCSASSPLKPVDSAVYL